ncbi:hypothetical protein [Mucilaginibacter sp. SJ]|uniref:hypothetical protein n=1 Tax=Mucilaginibacter sp. SJ TaxID=3029053 RepID=UPI0023A94634|nr:hypothetical protein [Mucilaginibacter sp. SJ]WEA00546.1 hypothetical protein MusilaSJ_24115 [Mucilaginibacter sp. SJ]
MLLDRNKYTESGYIGETLIGDAAQQLEQRCMAVRQSVKDHDFSYEEALEAYQVSDADYKAFLGEDINRNIFISFSGTTTPIKKMDYFAIYETMLLNYFPHPSKRVKDLFKELSKEVASQT